MHFTDQGFVVAVRRHAESTGILKIFSKEHGLVSGVARGIGGKNARGLWQPGNRVLFTWSARLADQLGTFSGELLEPVAAHAMQNAAMLEAVSAMATLVSSLMPEREAHRHLFMALENFTQALLEGNRWQEYYARFELALLSECGFRLDLEECAATGSREELIHVSPKSGRAVSRGAGMPYRDRLLPLPAFLRDSNCAAEPSEIADALQLTGYFIIHWVLSPHGWNMPASRNRLAAQLMTKKVPSQ